MPNPDMGELTRPFVEAYEEITPQRLNGLLAEIREILTGDLKQRFVMLENGSRIAEETRSAPIAAQARKADFKP